MQDIPGQVSFMFDSWTSKNGDLFFSITGHYITAPVAHPEEWELKMEQLAFSQIEGNHSGANLANIIIHVVDRYDIRQKVCLHVPVFTYI